MGRACRSPLCVQNRPAPESQDQFRIPHSSPFTHVPESEYPDYSDSHNGQLPAALAPATEFSPKAPSMVGERGQRERGVGACGPTRRGCDFFETKPGEERQRALQLRDGRIIADGTPFAHLGHHTHPAHFGEFGPRPSGDEQGSGQAAGAEADRVEAAGARPVDPRGSSGAGGVAECRVAGFGAAVCAD